MGRQFDTTIRAILQESANVPGAFQILSSEHVPANRGYLMNPPEIDLVGFPQVYEPPTIDIAKSLLYSGHCITPRLAMNYWSMPLEDAIQVPQYQFENYMRCRLKVERAIRNCKLAIRRGDSRRKFYWWRVWKKWQEKSVKILNHGLPLRS